MVRARMGLLDDAIREHLELKRLKGADPQEVARQESDALGQETGALRAGDGDLPAAGDAGLASAGEPDTVAIRREAAAVHRPGQETVELDMESVMDGVRPAMPERAVDEHEQTDAERRQPGTASGGSHGEASQEDSLGWEMPGDQEAASDDGEGGEAGAGQEPGDEDVEDVLEETPDFLRETPEQERLWFEQRPPRDFDFNE